MLQEIQNTIALVACVFVGGVFMMAIFMSIACKNNPKLTDNVKDAAQEAGKKAAFKLVEWILKKK